MKAVKANIRLLKKETGWSLIIDNQREVIAKCLQQWNKSPNAIEIMLDCVIKSPFQFKTKSQLGYLHAEPLRIFHEFALESGNEWTEERSRTEAKIIMDFTEIKISPVDGAEYLDVKSFATASKEEVSDFIDRLIRFLADYGYSVETPYDYKKRMGITNFEEYEVQ